MPQPSTTKILIDEARCLLEALHVENSSNNIDIVFEALLTAYGRGYSRGSEKAVQIVKRELNPSKEKPND